MPVQKPKVNPNPVEFAKFHKRLESIRLDETLTVKQKTLHSTNTIRDFLVSNPAYISDQFITSIIRNLSSMRSELVKLKAEYNGFHLRNMGSTLYYTSREEKYALNRAEQNLIKETDQLIHYLSRAIAHFKAYKVYSNPENPRHKYALSTLKDAFTYMQKFHNANTNLQKHVTTMESVLAGAQEERRITQKYGAIFVGAAVALSGMWIAGVATTSVSGAAMVGGIGGVAGEQVKSILGTGELASLDSSIKGAALGAFLSSLKPLAEAAEVAAASRAIAAIKGTPTTTLLKTPVVAPGLAILGRVGPTASKVAKPVEGVYTVGDTLANTARVRNNSHDYYAQLSRE